MAKTYNRMCIDVNEKILGAVTSVAQDAQSRYLDVYLYNNSVPIDLTGEVVRIYVKKSDGNTVFEQGQVTDAVNGRCQFELTTQMLAVSGTLEVQISVWSSETEILSTQIFKIYVEPTLRIDEAVESTNEFGVLVVLFQEIQDALDTMNAIKTNFGEAGAKAAEYGATTFWEMLEVLAERADTRDIVKSYVNSTIDTPDFKPLDKMIGGEQIFDTAGSYSFTVPDGVQSVKIIAAAGGAGGNSSYSTSQYPGGGGGGGDCIEFTVHLKAGDIITFTIGAGGSSASNGSATVINNYLTLAGGNKGDGTTSGGLAGGTGGGKGGTASATTVSTSGEKGLYGIGGQSGGNSDGGSGGGGGGSYGNGGKGGIKNGGNGTDGYGGSGGGGGGSYGGIGGKGGDGIVIFRWGLHSK